MLFATPEYNHSLPGTLKNALDWLSRPLVTNPLWGKPVAVVGASTGLFGAVWAQAELRKVLRRAERPRGRPRAARRPGRRRVHRGRLPGRAELERIYEETLAELLARAESAAA